MPLGFLIVERKVVNDECRPNRVGAAAGIRSRSADARTEAAERDATSTETSGGARADLFSLGSDSLRVERIHVLPKKKGGLFDILALSTICQGQRLHQEQRERQESFSQRIKESRSLCQKLPESKAYDPLLS